MKTESDEHKVTMQFWMPVAQTADQKYEFFIEASSLMKAQGYTVKLWTKEIIFDGITDDLNKSPSRKTLYQFNLLNAKYNVLVTVDDPEVSREKDGSLRHLKRWNPITSDTPIEAMYYALLITCLPELKQLARDVLSDALTDPSKYSAVNKVGSEETVHFYGTVYMK